MTPRPDDKSGDESPGVPFFRTVVALTVFSFVLA
jgi:hypothetical protein